MLTSMRKGAGTWVARIFIVLIALSFAFWGTAGIFGTDQDPVVLEVGDRQFRASEVDNRFRQDVAQLAPLLGGFDYRAAISLGVLDRTLEALTEFALIDIQVDERGLAVGDDTLRAAILTNPAFAGIDGQFSRTTFATRLREVGLTEEEYLETVRRDVVRNQYLDALVTGMTLPTSIQERVRAHAAEERRLELAAIRASTLADLPIPTDADLRGYYEANPELFTAPVYRDVDVLDLTATRVAETLEIDEADIAAEYEARLDFFQTPERREVTQILFTDEEAARAARADLDTGTAIEAVTDAFPGAVAAELGEVAADDLPAALAAPVFALAPNRWSDPIQSPFGWQLITVSSVTPSTTQPLAEVRDLIRENLAQRIGDELVFDLLESIEDQLAGGASVVEIGREIGIPAVTVGFVAQDGTGPDDAPVAYLDASPAGVEVLQAAFETPVGFDSGVLDSRTAGGIFVVQVKDEIAPALRPFDTVSAAVETAWTDETRRRLARERAEALAAAVDPWRANVEDVLERRVLDPITRREAAADPLLTPDLLRRAFEAEIGATLVGAAGDGDGTVLLRVTEVLAGQTTDAATVTAQANQLFADTVLLDLRHALAQRTPVVRNDQALVNIYLSGDQGSGLQ